MRKKIVLFFLLISGLGFSQTDTPIYQQIAFDYFRTEIFDPNSVKKQINVYRYALSFKTNLSSFYIPRSGCISNNAWSKKELFSTKEEYTENLIYINPKRYKLDFSNLDEKLFKIKKNRRGNYPKLIIGSPYKENGNDDRILINIYLKDSHQSEVIYHLVLNQSGMIKNLCDMAMFHANAYINTPSRESVD